MRALLLTGAAIVGVIAASMAHASTIIGTHITEIVPNNGGIVEVYITTARTGAPSCAASTATAFDLNATTPGGQALLSGIYTAFATGATVDIGGSGICDAESSVESIGYIGIHK